MHLKTKPNLKNNFTTDGSQNILTILVLQFLKSFPLIAYSTSPLSVVQGENWALACPARILNRGWKWRQGHSHALGQVLIGEPGTIFSFNYVHYVSLIFSLWRKVPHSCMWSETWSRCAGLLFSDLVKLSQRPFGTRKWQGQFFQTALSGPHLLEINQLHLEMHSICPIELLCDFLENPLTSVIRNVSEWTWCAANFWQFLTVFNQLIKKVNKRRHISLSLNLFLHCWEVCSVFLQVFFEHLKFPLKGADSCHQIELSLPQHAYATLSDLSYFKSLSEGKFHLICLHRTLCCLCWWTLH